MPLTPVYLKVFDRMNMSVQLITNAVAAGNGEWVEARGFTAGSVHVSGITTATVQVSISNSPTKPLATDNGVNAGTSISSNGMVNLNGVLPARWVKARVTSYTSGTINADLELQQV
jgi:hypothetical protein